MQQRIEDGLGLLGGGSVIEVDQWLSVHGLVQDGKVVTNLFGKGFRLGCDHRGFTGSDG